MKHWILSISFVFLAFQSLTSQAYNTLLDNLNEQILFINDGIHGLILAHIIFENYNQDLNKYVDLEVDTVNAVFTNSLIDSKNVFSDVNNFPEYEVTPVTRFENLMKDSKTPEATKKYLKQGMSQLNEINTMRFVIEKYLSEHDLNVRANVYGAYELLEKCVALFEAYYLTIQNHYEEISQVYLAQNISIGDHEKLYHRFSKTQKANKAILDALRAKTDFGFEALIHKLGKEYSQLKKVIQDEPAYSSLATNRFLYSRIESSIDYARKFYETADVPARRKLYGKFYYYYNDKMLASFNRYATGYVQEMNVLIDKLGMEGLYLMEMPRYLKVIYPKVLDTIDHIASSDNRIDIIPTKLKNREIKESSYSITSPTKEFTLKLYDHKIQDGDIVSINFNGDWILEKQSIESKPIELKLLLNEEGKNYLLLHAVNEGRRPPNTMAMKYFDGTEEQEISLSSDLDTSELIEIEFKP